MRPSMSRTRTHNKFMAVVHRLRNPHPRPPVRPEGDCRQRLARISVETPIQHHGVPSRSNTAGPCASKFMRSHLPPPPRSPPLHSPPQPSSFLPPPHRYPLILCPLLASTFPSPQVPPPPPPPSTFPPNPSLGPLLIHPAHHTPPSLPSPPVPLLHPVQGLPRQSESHCDMPTAAKTIEAKRTRGAGLDSYAMRIGRHRGKTYTTVGKNMWS